ncbi:ComEA family DNA-binding protein [Paenibacillus baekrokdamisoli]|nr:ComEA family DNA-binding protein [Paenibacillus baekrokdamisoli]
MGIQAIRMVGMKGDIRYMRKGNHAANNRQQILIVALLLVSVILLTIALWPSASSEPLGWVAVNSQVEQTLAVLEQKEETKKPSAAENDKSSIVVEADKKSSQLKEGTQDEQKNGQQPQQAQQPRQTDGKLNINQATAEQLDALPGIGEVKARTIVEDREKNGAFRTVDDLRRVKGIGPKLLEKLKSSIVALP